MASELGHIFCPAADLCRDLDSGMHAAVSRIIPTAADDDRRKGQKRAANSKWIAENQEREQPILLRRRHWDAN